MVRRAIRPLPTDSIGTARLPGSPAAHRQGRIAGLTLAAALLAAGPALAQEIHGRISVKGSGEAIVGAFVRLVDEDGKRAAASLTDRDGRYRIGVRTPGHYRIHVEFLGYAPYASEPVSLGRGRTVVHDVALAIRPIELPEIAAEVEGRCDAPGTGRALELSLWEATRTALRVASWAAQAGLVDYRIARTSRQLDRRSLEPLISYRAELLWQLQGSPWGFTPAAELLREGFARRHGDGTVQLLVPGPDIFLEDAFLDAHCFHVRTTNPPARGLIGLAFDPVRDDDASAEISGVLWLDRDGLVLHSLDFRYVIPWRPAPILAASGTLRFAYLESGLWIIRDWKLHMPLRLGPRSPRDGDLIVEDGARVVFALDETGDVIWADTAFAREPGRDGGLGEVASSFDPTPTIFTTHSPAAIAAQGCGLRHRGERRIDVIGFVGDIDGTPLQNARVVVRWADGRRVREAETQSNLAGLFGVCALPPNVEIEIEATRFGFVPWVERGRTRPGRLYATAVLLRPARR